MTFRVSILTTGSEILDGRVLDTNSNFVAKQLAELGLSLHSVLAVDDDMAALLAGLRYLHQTSDLVITSGGLGPTTDDLTREMVATYCGVPLVESPEARTHLEGFYAKRKRVLDPANLTQALLPQSSVMIPNPNGTAPGFTATSKENRLICALSGVPREFHAMFNASVLPLITSRAVGHSRIDKVFFKIFGVPESAVGSIVTRLGIPSEITVSYRAAFPEVHLGLKSSSGSEVVERAAELVRRSVLASCIFTESPSCSFAQLTHTICAKHRITLAVAESCTGGLLGELLTAPSGASEFFLGGVISYSNEIKQDLLGVSPEALRMHGAVSAEVAGQMAVGVKKRCGSSVGISVTGIAGPSGGSDEKPVGTFFVGIASQTGEVAVKKCFFVSDRSSIRQYAAYVALDLLRRQMSGLDWPESYPILPVAGAGH